MNSFEPARGDVGVSGGGVTIDVLNQVEMGDSRKCQSIPIPNTFGSGIDESNTDSEYLLFACLRAS